MKKYPKKSNWISYTRLSDGDYIVHNHIFDEDHIMTGNEVKFIESLDGKVNPCNVLRREFGMSRTESREFIERLMDYGILRQGNRLYGSMSTITVFKIYNSSKYQKIALMLLAMMAASFIPLVYAGIRSAYRILVLYDFDFIQANIDGTYWLGTLIGFIAGLIFHELSHAIAGCALGAQVMEFGVAFNGLPTAYTLIDASIIPRARQVVIDLAGVVANLMISALSMCTLYQTRNHITVYLTISLVNIEFALINLLFMEGTDGCHTITKLLGPEDIYEKCGTYLKKFKFKARKTALSENEKTVANMFRILCLTKWIYPILILFYLCVWFGW